MILFCNACMLYISLLFSVGSKSTKNKFSGSLEVLCIAFMKFRTLCHSSNCFCFISSISVQ